jgi:hypothetical protein
VFQALWPSSACIGSSEAVLFNYCMSSSFFVVLWYTLAKPVLYHLSHTSYLTHSNISKENASHHKASKNLERFLVEKWHINDWEPTHLNCVNLVLVFWKCLWCRW